MDKECDEAVSQLLDELNIFVPVYQTVIGCVHNAHTYEVSIFYTTLDHPPTSYKHSPDEILATWGTRVYHTRKNRIITWASMKSGVAAFITAHLAQPEYPKEFGIESLITRFQITRPTYFEKVFTQSDIKDKYVHIFAYRLEQYLGLKE